MYAAKMHNYTDLCRKRAQDVMNDSKNLYSKINSELEKEIIECISSNNTDKKALLEQVENIFSKKKKIFTDISTEHRVFSHFKRLETFIQPESYLLGERTEFVSENGVLVLKLVPVTANFVPLLRCFASFFQHPRYF